MKRSTHLLTILTLAGLLALAATASATPRPCRQGLKGTYVTWSKTGAATGIGEFAPSSGRASVLSNFTWDVTGEPLNIQVASDEPFSGGNSMKGIYGRAEDETNLNIRIQANNTRAGAPFPHDATLKLTFDAGTPASGWGFAVVDIDVDQVKISATDTNGNSVPNATIAQWFVQKFDANPSQTGVNIPSWDAANGAVVGSESSSTKIRTTVEGNLTDTEAGSAWFQPNVSLRTLSFKYNSLQVSATPSFHVFVAACSTTYVAPTATPAPSGDSDGDTIPDSIEGTGDIDNDDIPNYLDKDSDNDTIADSIEGSDDTDNDEKPDFVDGDSDGDGVPDIIERDPDSTPVPSGEDTNRDGVDDGNDSRTNTSVEDEDTDSIPNTEDSDSDNDGKSDGEEAYDLDGDGTPDVEPSGEDSNGDGVDDSFEKFDSPTDINQESFGGPSTPPCTRNDLSQERSAVLKHLSALAARTPAFATRAASCGAKHTSGLIAASAIARRALQREMRAGYKSEELVCPETVCPLEDRSTTLSSLNRLAKRVYTLALAAKKASVTTCGEPPSTGPKKPETRPTTATYLARLQAALKALPRSVTRCE